MALTFLRIDDRLIHGQVVTVWLRAIGVNHIVIVDDETADDPFLCEILSFAAPPGVEVEVHAVNDAVPRLQELGVSATKVCVLMRSPEAALRLHQAGVSFPALNVGGLGSAPDRTRIHKTISASEAEVADLQALAARGVRVEFQTIPDDIPVPLATVISRTTFKETM